MLDWKSFSHRNLCELINCFIFCFRYNQERRKADVTKCEYNDDKGYVRGLCKFLEFIFAQININYFSGSEKVIYSASGSFFIPMSIMLYVYSKIFYVLTSRQSRISRTEVSANYYHIFSSAHDKTNSTTTTWQQACERSIDVETEFVTSEIDTSYPQGSKDMVINNAIREPPQTTLYELLEYAKTRSILKGNSSNLSSGNGSGSNHSSFVIRSLNSVQFNQNQSLNENSSIKSKKKMPIRISSLKRETKTAQTLRYAAHILFSCLPRQYSQNRHQKRHRKALLPDCDETV